MTKRPAFADFTQVSLTHPVEAEGVVVPTGETGVIMAVYADGAAYEVEFAKPHRMVITLEEKDIRLARTNAA